MGFTQLKHTKMPLNYLLNLTVSHANESHLYTHLVSDIRRAVWYVRSEAIVFVVHNSLKYWPAVLMCQLPNTVRACG